MCIRDRIQWMAFEYEEDEGVDLRKDPMALQRLKEAAEKAKINPTVIKSLFLNNFKAYNFMVCKNTTVLN